MIKKFLIRLNVAFLLVVLLASAATDLGAQAKSASSKTAEIFPVSELKEGMRGTARSVFRGSNSEEFQVEILGVLPNYVGPKQDMIIGRLSGANAERTFVFAGMSGSPVYINGKLLGAIAYSFPFAKEPICGITPFDQMVSLVERAPIASARPTAAASFSYADLMGSNGRLELGRVPEGAVASGFRSDSLLAAVAGQSFRPIATPLTISGVPQRAIDAFAPSLQQAGFLPVTTPGGDTRSMGLKPATETTLLGGDSVSVHLSRGDIQIAAAGTVTHRDGNKIYAFGHPFFSLGTAELPMSESHVVTVVPNTNNSFKLSVSDSMVGTMTQDRATGIYGLLGQAPKMIPVKITLTTSRGRREEVNFETAIDELLTPLIINMGLGGTLIGNERAIGDSTVEMRGEIRVKGEQPIRIERRFAGPQAPVFAAAAGMAPISALLRANFENLEITGAQFDLTAVDGSQTAVVDRISADRSQARAGETVEIGVNLRTESGKIVNERVSITVPADTEPGRVTVTIADGSAAMQNSASAHFTPRSAGELVDILNKLKRPERLYAVISRTSPGAVIGSNEFPSLPPSMLATFNNDRSAGGIKATVNTIVAEVDARPLAYVVSGSHKLELEIIR